MQGLLLKAVSTRMAGNNLSAPLRYFDLYHNTLYFKALAVPLGVRRGRAGFTIGVVVWGAWPTRVYSFSPFLYALDWHMHMSTAPLALPFFADCFTLPFNSTVPASVICR